MAQNLQEIAGTIRVLLGQKAGRIDRVDIISTRPKAAARMFEGKSADETAAAIGRVFSLCGTAQTVAALEAAEAALACPADPATRAARNAARRAEMATQLVTRIALHWPRVLGLPLAPEAVRGAMAAERAIEARLLGEGWRRPGAGISGAAESDMVPRIDFRSLVEPLAEALEARGLETFGALPEHMAPEAGVLSQYWQADQVRAIRNLHGAGLAARLAAVGAALAALPDAIAADLSAAHPVAAGSWGRSEGTGSATVETARGPLTHHVEIREGRVTRCSTAAPTETNFAPGGPVAAGLLGERPDVPAAELHVLAIDPCVAASVELAPT